MSKFIYKFEDHKTECDIVSVDIEKPRMRYNLDKINQMKEWSTTIEANLSDDEAQQAIIIISEWCGV